MRWRVQLGINSTRDVSPYFVLIVSYIQLAVSFFSINTQVIVKNYGRAFMFGVCINVLYKSLLCRSLDRLQNSCLRHDVNNSVNFQGINSVKCKLKYR